MELLSLLEQLDAKSLQTTINMMKSQLDQLSAEVNASKEEKQKLAIENQKLRAMLQQKQKTQVQQAQQVKTGIGTVKSIGTKPQQDLGQEKAI